MGEFGNYYRTRLLDISNVATPTIFNYLPKCTGAQWIMIKESACLSIMLFSQKTLEFF